MSYQCGIFLASNDISCILYMLGPIHPAYRHCKITPPPGIEMFGGAVAPGVRHVLVDYTLVSFLCSQDAGMHMPSQTVLLWATLCHAWLFHGEVLGPIVCAEESLGGLCTSPRRFQTHRLGASVHVKPRSCLNR